MSRLRPVGNYSASITLKVSFFSYIHGKRVGLVLLGTIHIWSASNEGKVAECVRNKAQEDYEKC
jgi:hypothetical protein